MRQLLWRRESCTRRYIATKQTYRTNYQQKERVGGSNNCEWVTGDRDTERCGAWCSRCWPSLSLWRTLIQSSGMIRQTWRSRLLTQVIHLSSPPVTQTSRSPRWCPKYHTVLIMKHYYLKRICISEKKCPHSWSYKIGCCIRAAPIWVPPS